MQCPITERPLPGRQYECIISANEWGVLSINWHKRCAMQETSKDLYKGPHVSQHISGSQEGKRGGLPRAKHKRQNLIISESPMSAQAEAEADNPSVGRFGHGCNGAAAAQRHREACKPTAPLCTETCGTCSAAQFTQQD